MTDFSKILDKAKEIEAKMKESQANRNQPNKDAITGSPRGTDAIAVGDKYFKT